MRSQGALSGNVTLDRALSVFQGYLMERYGYFKRDFVALGIQEKDAGQAVKAASGLLLAAAIHIGVVSLGAYSMKMNLPERSFLRSALAEMESEIKDGLEATMAKAVKP